MTAIVSCPMNFHRYPKDTIICRLDFRSYSNDLEKVFYRWSIEGMILNPDLKLLQYDLRVGSNVTNKTNIEGNFSVVEATFEFKRQIKNKLFQVYLPSLLTVTMSWLSFWISLKTVGNGRITLLVMCLLAITSQFVSVRKELPRLSYITIMDVWMLGCLVFLFGSVFEFSFAKYLKSIHEKHLQKIEEQKRMDLIASKRKSNLEITSISSSTNQYNSSVQKYPLVPGYSQYLNAVIHNRIEHGITPNEMPQFGCKYNKNYLQEISSKYLKRENNTIEEKLNTKDEENVEHEVIWFKRADRISRLLFPVAFGFFLLIYSWILLKI